MLGFVYLHVIIKIRIAMSNALIFMNVTQNNLKKKMKKNDLYKKCQLLKAGQVVEIAGDWFKAYRVAEAFEGRECEACELDSICKGDVALVCYGLGKHFGSRWYLKLAHR